MALAAVIWLVARVVMTRYLPAPQRPMVLTVITLLVVAALNAVNLCAPGWCTWYGFPVHYYSWSDAMITFNGVCSGCPAFHPVGAIVNVAFATTVCVFIFRHERRRHARGPVV